jgi:hypothetical protein
MGAIMKLITIFFILNATILLLHEIESSYEREWEILKLPGKITGFLLLHIPIIILLFYGVIEIERQSYIGLLLGVITGIGGLIPFLVHKLLIVRKDKFNLYISNTLIYTNIITGVITFVLSVRLIIKL